MPHGNDARTRNETGALRMDADAARAEFDRLRERFERELRGRIDNPSGPAGRLPLPGEGEETGEAQTSADMEEDDGFWATEIRRG